MSEARPSTLRDYLRVVGRRKLVILVAALALPAAALVVSLRQSPLYEAEAQVLLNRQSLANTLAGTTDPAIFEDAERVVQTQAELASVPAVAARVVAAVPLARLSASELLDASRVEPRANVDLLEFTVEHSDSALASELASAYAREYTLYRTQVETRALVRTRVDLRSRIAQLRQRGTGGPVLAGLLEKEQQLLLLETLQTGNATVVRAATTAEQVRPQPVRNVALGLVLGLGGGLLLAFLLDALDTRVRTVEELEDVLALNFLGRLPPPPGTGRLVRSRGLDPDEASTEAFQILRTNVEFANLDVGAKTIMLTSSVEGEGKSTTALHLAHAFAVAGKRVVLLELDVRKPTLKRLFDLGSAPGASDVVLGYAPLESALLPVTLPGEARSAAPTANGSRAGGLWLLHAGTTAPNPAAFVGSRRVAELLRELREKADLVLVDAPPLLQVSDAMTLSAMVDALLVLARLKVLRRATATELRRALDASPAPALGFAVTGVSRGAGYGYGYGERPRTAERLGTLFDRRGAPAEPAGPSRSSERRAPSSAAR